MPAIPPFYAGGAPAASSDSTSPETVFARPGDTPEKIAQDHNIDVNDLMGANGITDPNQVLFPGRELKLPHMSYGDTPSPAAQAFVGQWLQSFAQFPPRQKPASFNLEQVIETKDVRWLRVALAIHLRQRNPAALLLHRNLRPRWAREGCHRRLGMGLVRGQ